MISKDRWDEIIVREGVRTMARCWGQAAAATLAEKWMLVKLFELHKRLVRLHDTLETGGFDARACRQWRARWCWRLEVKSSINEGLVAGWWRRDR